MTELPKIDAGSKLAYAYYRCSGLGQVDGDWLERQRDTVWRFAERHGYVVVGEFADAGVSGTKELAARNELARMFDLLQNGEGQTVKVVLFENADRLSRDLIVGEIFLSDLRKLGVAAIDCASGHDLTVPDGDATRTLIRQVLGAIAQYAKTIVVLRTRAARDRKRAMGIKAEGAPKYGCRNTHEAMIVSAILEWRREGLSHQDIADKLNLNRWWNRRGRPWSRQRVQQVESVTIDPHKPRRGRTPKYMQAQVEKIRADLIARGKLEDVHQPDGEQPDNQKDRLPPA